MTHNFTISIAAKWFEDSTNPALTPEQRAAGKKAYEETIITASSQQAGRHADQIPLRRQDRGDLHRRQEQGGGQGNSSNSCCRKKIFAPMSRARSAAGSGDIQPPAEPVWQADRHRKAVYTQFHGRHHAVRLHRNYKFTILNNENVSGPRR